MKERISVTLDREIISILNSLIKDRKYRNRSHAVEMAIAGLDYAEKAKAEKKGK
ncbi:ribbon-helix-helix protein, CopG family [Candidatus Woesearchaeota archaeon]|nr:ribbon-helix-helix protein, CopG family [Candidatus Woesearchaeota archaeon]